MRGYVQVYTGDGKGKTTAAFGLALRAAGAGLKVYIGQFLKNGGYSELNSINKFKDLIKIEQFGGKRHIGQQIGEEDKELAKKGFEKIRGIIFSGEYDVVVLDEINVALYLKLLPKNDLINVIKNKPPHVELVLTGRYASPQIVEIADLVTEMRKIKHYFSKGVTARKGIEK